MDLANIYRIFYTNKKEHTVFSATHRSFARIDDRYKEISIIWKIEITPCILSDHHGLKLNINNNRNMQKQAKHAEASWALNDSPQSEN